MPDPQPDEDQPPSFTFTITYSAANLEDAEWLAGFAVQALRCDPKTTDWTVTDA